MTSTADLRALAEKATPGPWQPDGPWDWGHDEESWTATEMVTARRERTAVVVAPPPPNGPDANIAYIAACSPDVITALLDRLDAAEAENAALRATMARVVAVTNNYDSAWGVVPVALIRAALSGGEQG